MGFQICFAGFYWLDFIHISIQTRWEAIKFDYIRYLKGEGVQIHSEGVDLVY